MQERRGPALAKGVREDPVLVSKILPPKGVHQTVVPQYDPRSDVNYTFTVTQSSCLYWSEDEEKWTSDGCKVH